ATAGARPKLPVRGRRADDRAQAVPVRALTGRALPGRPPSGVRERRRRCGLLRPRLQVLLGDRRDPRRPRAGRTDAPRHRALPPRSILTLPILRARAWWNWIYTPALGAGARKSLRVRVPPPALSSRLPAVRASRACSPRRARRDRRSRATRRRRRRRPSRTTPVAP